MLSDDLNGNEGFSGEERLNDDEGFSGEELLSGCKLKKRWRVSEAVDREVEAAAGGRSGRRLLLVGFWMVESRW